MSEVAKLATLDRAALARLWSDLLGGPVPTKMSQILQRRFLAHALQVKVSGDLPAAAAARLDRIAVGKEREATPALQPGGRLLRQWNGTTHVVDVVKNGYLWNSGRHKSLSAIARAITGIRWSGPRFFGLKQSGERP